MKILTNTNFTIMLKKEIRDCKIYSPFSHYKGNGFELE